MGGGEAGVSGSQIIPRACGPGSGFGVVELDIERRVYGCELFFPKEEGSGSFHFFGKWLMPW